METDKYWAETLQALTEDENGRIRKNDIEALQRTDIVEFTTNLKFFEKRQQERIDQLNALRNK
jgi:hypothetical protein